MRRHPAWPEPVAERMGCRRAGHPNPWGDGRSIRPSSASAGGGGLRCPAVTTIGRLIGDTPEAKQVQALPGAVPPGRSRRWTPWSRCATGCGGLPVRLLRPAQPVRPGGGHAGDVLRLGPRLRRPRSGALHAGPPPVRPPPGRRTGDTPPSRPTYRILSPQVCYPSEP